MPQFTVHSSEPSLFASMPVLLYAGQISDEPNWSFPMHQHDDVTEIIYIAEGRGEFTIEGVRYEASAGDVLVYNQRVLHEEKSCPDHPLKTYFCGIGQLRLIGAPPGCLIDPQACPVIRTGKYRKKVEGYISDIFEEVHSQIPGFDVLARHLLVSLIVLIARIVKSGTPEAAAPENRRGDALGQRIQQFIDKHYTQDIPLQEIADRLYISPFYMSRIFRKQTGYSPINYIIQRRVGQAKTLLLTTDRTVQDIAAAVGYDNTSYFSMLFKKIVGASPKKFRDTGRMP